MIYPTVGTALDDLSGTNAKVIATKMHSLDEVEATVFVVLCYLKGNDMTPYVTWIYDAERVACFHGDYCYDFEQAIKSFNERGRI